MKRISRSTETLASAALLIVWISAPAHGQLGMFSKEQRVEFTREWKGERFPDGRPKIPDEVLARLKNVTAEEGWAVAREE